MPNSDTLRGRNGRFRCDECRRVFWMAADNNPDKFQGYIDRMRGREGAADCGASHWFCENCLDAMETRQAVWEARLERRAHGRVRIFPHVLILQLAECL